MSVVQSDKILAWVNARILATKAKKAAAIAKGDLPMTISHGSKLTAYKQFKSIIEQQLNQPT